MVLAPLSANTIRRRGEGMSEETAEYVGKIPWQWEHALISAYQPLVSTKGWKACPKCKQYPWLWIFDNGRYAKCQCGGKYDASKASAEAVCQYANRNNGSLLGYDGNALQKAWNEYCEREITK
jgi:hypothetical protein